jgi:hypothetical protein
MPTTTLLLLTTSLYRILTSSYNLKGKIKLRVIKFLNTPKRDKDTIIFYVEALSKDDNNLVINNKSESLED